MYLVEVLFLAFLQTLQARDGMIPWFQGIILFQCFDDFKVITYRFSFFLLITSSNIFNTITISHVSYEFWMASWNAFVLHSLSNDWLFKVNGYVYLLYQWVFLI